MLVRFRSVLFLLFVFGFAITAASVIFYAFGYRFSVDRGLFIYTGSLSLKTNVETVDIKIDNELIPKRRIGILNNSIQVTGLAPGEHLIEVSAPGHKAWNKKIVIQSGITTEFWNILLVEENKQMESLPGTENVIKVFTAPNGLFALVKKQENVYSVEILDVDSEEKEQVFATDKQIFSPELQINLEWSPESHKIMIPLRQEGLPVYAIVNVKTKETVYLNELAKLETPITSPRWDATSKDFLFFLSGTTLYRINTEAEIAVPVVVKENIAAYEISGSYLYYLSSQNGVVYQILGSNINSVSEQITPYPAKINANQTYSLIAYDEDRLAILEQPSGTLAVFNRNVKDTPLKQIQTGVQSLQYSDDGKKLLYYTDHEIFVYFNEDWKAQPLRDLDTIIQVARFSTPIRNTQWAEDYEHVIFSLNGNIKVAELDNRDRRNIFDLLVLPSKPLQILSRFGENKLYIVPEDFLRGMESIVFPESTGFLGF